MEAQMHMQIPVFNGDNHEIWSIKMKTLLMARDLWDVVVSGVSEENTNQESAKKRQKDLIIKDMAALHMLQMAVTESIFLGIGRATSSKQAWEILKADFGETELIRCGKRVDLEMEYHQMVMKNEESFREFTVKFMEVAIANRAKFYGNNITDQQLMRKILRSLPPRFNYAAINIRCEAYTVSELLYVLGEFEETSQFHSNSKRGRR